MEPALELFPLPLMPFERLMLEDARKYYPMTFCLVFDFSGALDRSKFESSIHQALLHHPLLGACVKKTFGRSPVWVRSSLKPQVRDATDSASSAWLWEAWDLRQEIGLRIDIRPQTQPQHYRISFGFHHSATDGIGGFTFVSDVLRAYARACDDASLQRLKPRSLDGLWVRDGLAASPPAARQASTSPPASRSPSADESQPAVLQHVVADTQAPVAPAPNIPASNIPTPNIPAPNIPAPAPAGGLSPKAIFAEVRRMLLTRPKPIDAYMQRSESASYSEPLAEEALDEDLLRGLRIVASERDCQLNDVCASVLFQTICDWNKQSSRVHRMTVPVSLRSYAHRHMPAANCMSYIFLQRTRQECQSLDLLMSGIHWEVHAARHEGWSRIFILGLGWAERLPGLLRFIMRPSKCMSSLVLSDVGDVMRRMMRDFPRESGKIRIGGLRLERVSGCPPVRPKTRLAVGTVCYSGKMFLAAAGCPKTMGKAGTAAFLESYVERLRKLASQPHGGSPA